MNGSSVILESLSIVNRSLEFLLPAPADAAKDIQGYDRQSLGLGRAFLADLKFQVLRIHRFTESYPKGNSVCRRANLQRFPYAIIYRVLPSVIQIIAIFPYRGDPATLASRTSNPSE